MEADVGAEVRHLLVELGLGLAAVVLRIRRQLTQLRLGVVGRQQRARYAALRGTGGLVSGGGNVGVGGDVDLAVLLVLALVLAHDAGLARARAGVSVGRACAHAGVTVDCCGEALAATATASTLARQSELHKRHERDTKAQERHLSPVRDTLSVSQCLSCLS